MSVPHLIPYQGSKRSLAPRILGLLADRRFNTCYEPFAGSAAFTLAAAQRQLAARFIIGESLVPLAGLWQLCLSDPQALADRYEHTWQSQHTDPRAHYNAVRARYNADHDPVNLLYLLARCVKNAPRFAADGTFNQSADHRRRGRSPTLVRRHALAIADLLADRCEAVAGDFAATCKAASAGDLCYLDPPWHGTTVGADKRYHAGLSEHRLLRFLGDLAARGVTFALSYDGRTGDRVYRTPLPAKLGLLHIELDAGRSSQETLSGRTAHTFESLYLSGDLATAIRADPQRLDAAGATIVQPNG